MYGFGMLPSNVSQRLTASLYYFEYQDLGVSMLNPNNTPPLLGKIEDDGHAQGKIVEPWSVRTMV